MQKKKFGRLLLKWHRDDNTRSMPWKGEKDPYLIWLSEIILQQTRVEQGLPYFIRFKQHYPTVNHLAAAPEDEVMRLWQGLGYYSRARNLHHTAKYISHQLSGRFPSTFNELKKLKGVGDYTAAAIASFAFNESKAVVDGNVIRILARVFGIDTPFDTTAGKKKFAELAQELISSYPPAEYNQSIMDFGSQVCTPQKPLCNQCILAQDCHAYQHQLTGLLPVREKKTELKNRWFNYLLLQQGNFIYIRKRAEKDIWRNLYELPLIETPKAPPVKAQKLFDSLLTGFKYTFTEWSNETVQLLSHRKIHFRFATVHIHEKTKVSIREWQKVAVKDLHKYGFPRTIHLFLKQKHLL